MMQRRRVMLAAGKRSRLPREYQEVEYLKSSGKQYIDTELVLTQDASINIRFFIDSGTTFSIFGSRKDAFLQNIGLAGAASFPLYADFGDYTKYRSYIGHYTCGDVYDVSISRILRKIYNVTKGEQNAINTKAVSGQFTTPGSAFIFNQRNGFSSDGLNGGVISCVINDTTESRNLIPCYRKSDHKPGMYDLCGSICSRTNSPFYINAGTGEFLVGPEVN